MEACRLSSQTCTPVREASTWEGKYPLRCTQDCALWPASGKPGSAVSLDPAWSPDGQLLAYVKSPIAFTGGQPPLGWFEAQKVFVFNPARGPLLQGTARGKRSNDGHEQTSKHAHVTG